LRDSIIADSVSEPDYIISSSVTVMSDARRIIGDGSWDVLVNSTGVGYRRMRPIVNNGGNTSTTHAITNVKYRKGHGMLPWRSSMIKSSRGHAVFS